MGLYWVREELGRRRMGVVEYMEMGWWSGEGGVTSGTGCNMCEGLGRGVGGIDLEWEG